MAAEPDYDVAVSFADEDRDYVKQVVESLRGRRLRVFYDADHEVELWGEDLVAYLDAVYRQRSRYVVIFISEAYVRKEWTRHELRSALARAVRERRAYVLPARFDATDVPGLPDTVRHMDCTKLTAWELADRIARKLGRRPRPSSPPRPDPPQPDPRPGERNEQTVDVSGPGAVAAELARRPPRRSTSTGISPR